MAERDIRKAIKDRAEALGGEIRAVSWLGRRHAPDVLVLIPPRVGQWPHLSPSSPARNEWVEAKCEGGRLSPGQEREHERMRKAGCIVYVIWTPEQIDEHFPLP